jgi:hypothetical protein
MHLRNTDFEDVDYSMQTFPMFLHVPILDRPGFTRVVDSGIVKTPTRNFSRVEQSWHHWSPNFVEQQTKLRLA